MKSFNGRFLKRFCSILLCTAVCCTLFIILPQAAGYAVDINGNTLRAATFIIDPGHGGSDSGATDGGSRYESNDVLRLSLRVGQLLINSGQSVAFTRVNDATLSLSDRSSAANNGSYSFFLSIHRNAASSAAAGYETYYYSGESAASTSAAFATRVQANLIATPACTADRGVKSADFHVIRETNIPAILTEVGFITNAGDNNLFDTYFENLASAIAQGCLDMVNGGTVIGGMSCNAYPIEGGCALMLVDGETTNGIKGQFSTTIIPWEDKRQGTYSLQMFSTEPKGQSGNVGSMARVTYAGTYNLTIYNGVSLWLFVGRDYTDDALSTFSINFMSENTEDGFNYHIKLAGYQRGWHKIIIPLSEFVQEDSAQTLEAMKYIRMTWFNHDQTDATTFLVDELKAVYYSMPSKKDDTTLSIYKGEDANGVEEHYDALVLAWPDKSEGENALQIYPRTPLGLDASGAAAMAVINLVKPVDFTKYKYITFDMRVACTAANYTGRNGYFQINLVSSLCNGNQDGYNYNLPLYNTANVWHNVKIPVSEFEKAYEKTDLSKIQWLRLTWFNIDKLNENIPFLIDDVRAYNDTPVTPPVVSEPDVSSQIPSVPEVSSQIPSIPTVSSQTPSVPEVSSQIPSIPTVSSQTPSVPAVSSQTSTSTATQSSQVTLPKVYGDVNFNGEVDAVDALLTMQYSVERLNFNSEQLIVADVDGDKYVRSPDALLILQFSVSSITAFPIEKK